MKRSLQTVCALAIITLVSTPACSLLPDRPPSPELHDFGPQRSASRHRTHLWSRVSVTAPDWLRDTKLRYRLLYRQPTRVQFYSLDRWVAPPPDLLSQTLTAGGTVTGCPLHVQLLTLEQVFTSPDQAHAAIEFIAQAGKGDEGDGHIRPERRFMFSRNCASADAPGAVAAFSEAVDDAAEDLDEWLSSLNSGANPICGSPPNESHVRISGESSTVALGKRHGAPPLQ